MSTSQFIHELALQTGVSVIVQSGLETRSITLEVTNQPVDQVLSLVARRLGASLRNRHGLYYIGELKPEDKGVLVRRVRRMSTDKVLQVVSVFNSTHGKASVLPDGLLVLGDTVEVIQRVSDMLDQVESVESPLWVVQLHLVSWSGRALHDLGIDVAPAAKVALGFAAGSAAGAATGFKWDLSADLSSVLKAANESSDVSIVASPQFLLSDGETATFVQGDRVPIPKRVTSDQGTTRIEGFEFIQTGIDIQCALREMAENAARLKLNIKISDVKGFVANEAPITGQEQFSTTATVQAGGIYLLGTLEKQRHEKGQYLGWQSGDKLEDRSQLVQIWLQIYRVSGSFKKQSPQLPLSSSSPAALRPSTGSR